MTNAVATKEAHIVAPSTVRSLFNRLGVLPIFMLAVLVLFGALEPRMLSYDNLFNVARQSTYLAIVTMGQMLVLLTAGLDLSVGSTIALVSVVTAKVMVMALAGDPNAVYSAIAVGLGAGLAVGAAVGLINGLGVALFRVTPFMMTLGMLSMAFGLALTLSGGSPVYGMPKEAGFLLAYARPLGIPVTMYFAAAVLIVVYVLLNWTRTGRYFYAIGSNYRAAQLSGVRTRVHTVFAYVLCGLLAATAGTLLTARVLSGEANMGQDMVLASIAACVIGGVSLFGGVGGVGSAVMGAVFISLLTNGMNLVRVGSYLQQMVLGAVLILAIIIDQLRLSYADRRRS